MGLQSERPLDSVDWSILRELQADARLSYNELGRRVNLSSPAVAERVRKLEEAGVISGYHARVDPSRAGYPLSAFVEMRCTYGQCLLQTTRAEDFPEIIEIHKLTGDRCSMLRVRVTSTQHLEALLERLDAHGQARSSLVLSTQFANRPVVEPPPGDSDPPVRSSGWS
ncbi:Lrp/AsnC family transcriptional regulator [Flindersiella endophytica]